MRILFLCAATFVGGLLAGAMLWPSSNPSRARGADPARESSPSRAVVNADHDDAGDIESDAASDRIDAGGTPLRELAAQAAAQLERALRSEAATAFLDGDGTVTGTVRDPAGKPVSGVVVTASPGAQPFDLALAARYVRERPHENRNLRDAARDAIQGELWRRQVRVVERTDVDGRYELKNLVKGGHSLAAYHDDYDVRPVSRQQAKIQPDAEVDFVAQPVQGVRVDVLLPDGTPADYAWVSWRGPHGSGWQTWKPEGRVRLPIGTCTVKAQTWVPEALQSAEVEREVGPGSAGDTVILQLEGRRILTANLVPPAGLVMPDAVQFRLRRLEGNSDVDPAALGKDEFKKNATASAPGRASWYDLEPGRYLVAAFLGGRRPIGDAVAELGEGAADVDLPMEMPDPDSYVAVTLLGPGGGPIRKPSRFHILTGIGKRVRWHNAEMLRHTDGAWLALLPEVAPDAGDKAAVRVRTEYGTAQEPFDLRRPGTVLIRFGEPGHLGLKVERYAGSGVEGRLFAALVGDEGVAAQRPVRPDGTCDLRGVQPDEYSLVLFVRQKDTRWPILRRRVGLRVGEREQTVSVPALHTLRVRPHPRLRARQVMLRSSDPRIGTLQRRARPVKGVATFDALAAGAYEVSVGRKRIQVSVPGPPEVVVE